MTKHVDLRGAAGGPFKPDLQAIIATHLGTPGAEEAITKAVRADYRRGNPTLGKAETLVANYNKQLDILDAQRVRQSKALLKAPLTDVSMPGERPSPLTRHDQWVYFFTVAGTILGVGVDWHALAIFMSDSGTIETLTGRYWPSLFMSSVAISGALLIKAGAGLRDEEQERAYYSLIFRGAVGATLLYVVVFALTFSPHQADLASYQQMLAGDGASVGSPMAGSIKEIAPYFLVSAQLLAEMLGAPVIFYYAHRQHMVGRKTIVAKSKLQVHHEKEIGTLNARISALVEEMATYVAMMTAHTDMEASEIAEALHLYRQILDDRAHADRQFISKRLGGGA